MISNTIEIKSDIQKFTQKSELIKFLQETKESAFYSLVENKSNFYPWHNKSKFLDATIDFIIQQTLNNLSKFKTNLSKEDRQALKELKDDKTIVKDVRKEGAVVIMVFVHYEQMIYKQLEDKNTYQKVDPSCHENTKDRKQCVH